MKRSVLHCLATAVLVLASVASWHWRFEVIPGGLPETRIAEPMVGWETRTGLISERRTQHEVIYLDGTPVLKLSRQGRDERVPQISIWFGPLKHLSYIHIRCESRWQDVVKGPHPYLEARFSAHMKNGSGEIRHHPGGYVFAGVGSSDWKTREVILKLTDDMTDVGFAISMLGDSGTLQVRNLTMVAVEQRSWVPMATAAIVCGWIGLCSSLILGHADKPPIPNAVLASMVIVASSWVLVFPQIKSKLKPVPASFDVGDVKAPPPQPRPPMAEPSPSTSKPTTKPTTKPTSKPTSKPASNPTVSQEPASPTPESHRDSGAFHRMLRAVDREFASAHLVLFAALTLVVLLITGCDSQWHLPLAVALLSEVIPELTDQLGGWDDWADLFTNVAGVGLAVLIWHRLPLLKRFRTKVAN